VSREPDLRRRERESDTAICDCLSTSSRRKRHFEPAVGERFASPISTASQGGSSIRENRLGDLGRGGLDSADEYRAEAAASRQVLLHDFRDALRQRRSREGSTAMGIGWRRPYDLDGELASAVPVRKSSAARSVASRVIRVAVYLSYLPIPSA